MDLTHPRVDATFDGVAIGDRNVNSHRDDEQRVGAQVLISDVGDVGRTEIGSPPLARRQDNPRASDEELVTSIRAGDPRAWNELVNRHRGRLHSTCFRVTNDRNLAEDAVQDAFVKLVREIPDNRRLGDRVGAWLVVVARHAAIDLVRAQRRRHHCGLDDSVGTSKDEPGEVVLGHLAAKRVVEAMETLSPRDQEMLRLHHLDSVSLRHLADRYGLTEASMAVTIHRARARLKAALAKGQTLIAIPLQRLASTFGRWSAEAVPLGFGIGEVVLSAALAIVLLVPVARAQTGSPVAEHEQVGAPPEQISASQHSTASQPRSFQGPSRGARDEPSSSSNLERVRRESDSGPPARPPPTVEYEAVPSPVGDVPIRQRSPVTPAMAYGVDTTIANTRVYAEVLVYDEPNSVDIAACDLTSRTDATYCWRQESEPGSN